MKSVAIIVGSMRAGRIGPGIAHWVYGIAEGQTNFKVEIVDLAAWPLPMDDEPGLPKDGVYLKEHTKAWSQKIASCGGYIFVTPQYNWGYPASLKNALDHLFTEWNGKPALTVSYGHHGGEKCAAQLEPVLRRLGLRLPQAQPQIVIAPEMMDADGQIQNPAASFASHVVALKNAILEFADLLDS